MPGYTVNNVTVLILLCLYDYTIQVKLHTEERVRFGEEILGYPCGIVPLQPTNKPLHSCNLKRFLLHHVIKINCTRNKKKKERKELKFQQICIKGMKF